MNTLEQMIDRGHERVCFHVDQATGLRAIIAIHSTVLGNALGGTRRWHYATEADALYDVLRLSEGMTYKAACAGLTMGGAKSVILLPSHGQAGTEAEARAMGRFVDTFNGAYIAAEDVGVNTQFVDWMAAETRHVMGGETVSTGGDPSPFTARGVFNGMKACLAHLGRPLDFAGVTVAIQGVGSVGHHLATMLEDVGASIVAADISERNLDRLRETVPGAQIVAPETILTTPCDILAPCALGGVIDGNLAARLRCAILCGAANNILVDPDEDAVLLRNAGVLYAPDFVVNAGGLIELAGLHLGMTRAELDAKNDEIEATTREILARGDANTSTHAAAVALAKRRIADAAKEKVHAG
ncbi:MAG: Glu/Leu/Phe/Val dehydrogenase [Phycisphaerales bacterium]|nr:Glu/Leu/Phe/Val dehydrogenase [Phycisphaerales bacterium]